MFKRGSFTVWNSYVIFLEPNFEQRLKQNHWMCFSRSVRWVFKGCKSMNFLRCFRTKLLGTFIWHTSNIGSFIRRSYQPFLKWPKATWRSSLYLLDFQVMTEERALNFSNFNLRICRFKFPLYSVLQGQFCSTQELKLHDRTYFGSLRGECNLIWIWSFFHIHGLLLPIKKTLKLTLFALMCLSWSRINRVYFDTDI